MSWWSFAAGAVVVGVPLALVAANNAARVKGYRDHVGLVVAAEASTLWARFRAWVVEKWRNL